MKKLSVLFLGVVFLATTAFTVSKALEPSKTSANVEQIQGLYLFIKSKPVLEYEYLGTCKTSITWSAKASEAINVMIKKVKKDYPSADGVIFTDENLWQGDAIKFK